MKRWSVGKQKPWRAEAEPTAARAGPGGHSPSALAPLRSRTPAVPVPAPHLAATDSTSAIIIFPEGLVCICRVSKISPPKGGDVGCLLRFSKQPEGISCLSAAEIEYNFGISQSDMPFRIFAKI